MDLLKQTILSLEKDEIYKDKIYTLKILQEMLDFNELIYNLQAFEKLNTLELNILIKDLKEIYYTIQNCLDSIIDKGTT